MIDHFNNLLRHVFIAQIDEITDEAQVRFQPPDELWRTDYVPNLTVGGQPVNALSVYLVDLRENRKLRSNARARDIQNGMVNEIPAPPRMECHYLITAWSPAAVTPTVELTLDELALLYRVTAVLMNMEPPVLRDLYDPFPDEIPEALAELLVPVQVLPVEGFPKLAEFWGTMGADHPWKPAVYLVVTLPVILTTKITGPMVTTRITEYRPDGSPETAETWIQIGGHVLRPNPAPTPENLELELPVVGAWVALETLGGERLQTDTTNDLGRFTFGDLHEDSYRLRVRAAGFSEREHPITVPSPTGEYDVRLS